MSNIARDRKAEYNRRAYQKRRQKAIGPMLEDNVDNTACQHHDPPPPPHHHDPAPSETSQDIELTYDEYQQFKQWKELQNNLQNIKKKGDEISYIMTALKTLGVAFVPALMGVVQRALAKTIEQGRDAQSQNSTSPSPKHGSLLSDPLCSPQQSMVL